MEIISSRHNDRIKFLCKLRDRSKRNRYKMFLIEGLRELSRAIGVIPIETIFFCRKFFRGEGPEHLLSAADGAGIQLCGVGDDAFEKISNRENCDGLIGLANFWPTDLCLLQKKQAANSANAGAANSHEIFEKLEDVRQKIGAAADAKLILVAEGIEKAGNLGALMRSAESAAVDGLILCDPVTDIFNPNVVRSSQGALFRLPIAIGSNLEALGFLIGIDATIFAATPAAENFYFSENFTGATAIVVGSESGGLSDFWLKNDEIKKIALPQLGICDSLNVNDAAVIILYEAIRQRMRCVR
jgi:TrmH family RNA methyltransferase